MILITRPRKDAENTAKLVVERGYETLIEPLLEIEAIFSDSSYSVPKIAVFTSSNGVWYCPEVLLRSQPKVFTVGDATATAAKEAGFQDIVSAQGDVDDLYALMISSLKPEAGSIIHYSGSFTRGDLSQQLCAKGYDAREQIVYKAREVDVFSKKTRDALQNTKIRSALFFSPRTAKIFMEIIGQYQMESYLKKMTALCLSSATAEPLGFKEWADIRIAVDPNQSALLDLLQEACVK